MERVNAEAAIRKQIEETERQDELQSLGLHQPLRQNQLQDTKQQASPVSNASMIPQRTQQIQSPLPSNQTIKSAIVVARQQSPMIPKAPLISGSANLD